MSWGKEPNKLNINSLTSEYLEIIGSGSGGVDIIIIDAGTPGMKYQIIQYDGYEKKFSTMIEALNFFSHYGYELVNAYGVAAGMMVQSNYVIRKKA
jgi:hypothetical protein